jgi:hypothetical protein
VLLHVALAEPAATTAAVRQGILVDVRDAQEESTAEAQHCAT